MSRRDAELGQGKSGQAEQTAARVGITEAAEQMENAKELRIFVTVINVRDRPDEVSFIAKLKECSMVTNLESPISPKSKFTLMVFIASVVMVGFILKDKWLGKLPQVLYSPAPGENIVLMGDQIASSAPLDPHQRLQAFLEKQLGRTITNLAQDQDRPALLVDQYIRLGQLKPDVVILSLGAEAIINKEDLGQTLTKIREGIKAIHQKSAIAVYLELNPPFMGDNWSMAIGQLCNELKILCIKDIYQGYWNHRDLGPEKIQPPVEAQEKAAQIIATQLKPHLINP